MKVKIDFEILETKSTTRILINDCSEWLHLDKEQSSIEVTLPNKDPVTLPFKKFAINGLNSVNLGLGCTPEGYLLDLPDGIYKIRLLSCNDKFQKTKYYLQNNISQAKLDKLFTLVDYDKVNVDKERRDKLLTLDYLMRTSESATREGKLTLAEEFFESSLEQINNYLRCDDCF